MFHNLNITIEGGLDYGFPKMAHVRQSFPDTRLDNPADAVRVRVRPFLPACKGKRIAITAGSRGISGITEVLGALVASLQSVEAEPFIVAAMGSHGGATETGQREVLRSYGITEETMKVPVVCGMEAECIGQTAGGVRVFCQQEALHADGIIVVNKIKPHADFKGSIESGLCKMMVVGLGKHRGATEIHSYGFHRMAELLPQTADVFLAHAPVLFGIGILENAYDQLMDIAMIPKERIVEDEPRLLAIAKQNIATLQLSEIDVLVIDRIGKDISGEGMDPNVTGRPGSFLKEGFSAPVIRQIVVLGVTPASHGNGVGIGMADISTVACMEQLDLGLVYTNALTSTLLGPARLPVVLPNDRDAISAAARLCHRTSLADARIVHISDTLHLTDIEVSEAYEQEVQSSAILQRTSDYVPLQFDEANNLR